MAFQGKLFWFGPIHNTSCKTCKSLSPSYCFLSCHCSACVILPYTQLNQTYAKKSDNTRSEIEQEEPWWKKLINGVPSLSERYVGSTLGKRNLAMTIRSVARVCSVVLPADVLHLLDIPKKWARSPGETSVTFQKFCFLAMVKYSNKLHAQNPDALNKRNASHFQHQPTAQGFQLR